MRRPFPSITTLAVIVTAFQFTLGAAAPATQEEERRPVSRRTIYKAAGVAALAAGGIGTGVAIALHKKDSSDSPEPAAPPGAPAPQSITESQRPPDGTETQEPVELAFEFPTRPGTLELRFRTIGTSTGNSGSWRGVVIQPGQAASATAPISTEAITSSPGIQLGFGPTVQIGHWTVIMQLEPGSQVSVRDLQAEILVDGVLCHKFHNTDAMDRPVGAGNDERTSESFTIVCEAPHGPPNEANGSSWGWS